MTDAPTASPGKAPAAGSALAPVALGLRAVKGGAHAVCVAMERGEPRVVLSTFVATAAGGDRIALEPYAVAFELGRGPDGGPSADAAAAVAEGRARQARLAAEGLGALVDRLAHAGCRPVVAALLVNRAGWITDLLGYSLEWAEHAAVAEGLAVREALRHALAGCDAEIAEVDEKSLPELATDLLGPTPASLDARLRALGASAKPWRKEQKLACLAAWTTLAGRAAR